MQNRQQSTNHILMIEPVAFSYNQETGVDNGFQQETGSNAAAVAEIARREMLNLRDMFTATGVQVTTFVGNKDCPDDVFPNNWISTTPDGALFLYPMATPSRRRERREDITTFLKDRYDFVFDLSRIEKRGKSLEGTGVFVLDHVNKEAYVARSRRTDDDLIQLWGRIADYEPVVFDTHDGNTGGPVYHTNVVCHIGTGYAAIAAEMIVTKDRSRVLKRLGRNHEIITLTSDQVRNFSGNALEVVGHNDSRHLALSERAYAALTEKQIEQYRRHVTGFCWPRTLRALNPFISRTGPEAVRLLLRPRFRRC